MQRRDEIKIIDLLRLREEEFRKVHRCEEAIRSLLGGVDYPYLPLPELPSRCARTGAGAGRRTAAAKKAAPVDPLPWLRPLEAPEDAYLVSYRENLSAEIQTSVQVDRDLVRQFAALPEAGCQMLRVETVRLTGDDSWDVQAVLFERKDDTN